MHTGSGLPYMCGRGCRSKISAKVDPPSTPSLFPQHGQSLMAMLITTKSIVSSSPSSASWALSDPLVSALVPALARPIRARPSPARGCLGQRRHASSNVAAPCTGTAEQHAHLPLGLRNRNDNRPGTPARRERLRHGRLQPEDHWWHSPAPSSSTARATVQRHAALLSDLYTALDTQEPDKIFPAYIEVLRASQSSSSTLHSGTDGRAGPPLLAPHETRMVLRALMSDSPRMRTGMLRLITVIEQVKRSRAAAAATLAERMTTASTKGAEATNVTSAAEEAAWDEVLGPVEWNALISFIGRCMRTAGPGEVEEAMSLMAGMEAASKAKEGARKRAPGESGHTLAHGRAISAKRKAANRAAEKAARAGRAQAKEELQALDERQEVRSETTPYQELERQLAEAQKRPTKTARSRSPFPDQTTFNTLLDIISRSVPYRDSFAQTQNSTSDENSVPLLSDVALGLDHGMGMGMETDSHSGATARQLFYRLWERMVSSSHMEPDAAAWTSLIGLESRLGNWENVRKAVRDMDRECGLTIPALNAVLWAAARRQRENAQTVLEDVRAVYAQARGNLMRIERERRRRAHSTRWKAGDLDNDRERWDQSVPLEWPDRDYEYGAEDRSAKRGSHPPAVSKSRSGRAASPETQTQTQILRLLGIPHLPAHLIPDDITYALLIRTLAWSGDLAGALGVLQDMVSTPPLSIARVPQSPSLETGELETEMELAGTEGNEEPLSPTLAIYDSLFRGFARHAVPARLISLDPQDPSASTWTLDLHPPAHPSAYAEEREPHDREQDRDQDQDRDPSPWNVYALTELLEGFLKLRPSLPPGLSLSASTSASSTSSQSGPSPISNPATLRSTAKPHSARSQHQKANTNANANANAKNKTDEHGVLLARTAVSVLSNPARPPVASPTSASVFGPAAFLPGLSSGAAFPSFPPSSTAPTPTPTRLSRSIRQSTRAPTSRQLFFLVTALRRVSGDEPVWVLAQWERVREVFGDGRSLLPVPRRRDGSETDPDLEMEEGREEEGEDEDEERHASPLAPTQTNAEHKPNAHGWTGWRLDNRMDRLLAHLRDRVGQAGGEE